VRPVTTVAEARGADAAAIAGGISQSVLVARAGTAVALGAMRLLTTAYGRRVVVVAGKGNNGADGRVAASWLGRRGARVRVLDAGARRLPACDLVIDAAYGTGFSGSYEAPAPPDGSRVLAVDLPSGVDGDTGAASGRPMAAAATVTFAALKPGLLQGDGARLCGRVSVADIGIAVGPSGIALVDDDDVANLLPRRAPETHKWASAVCVVAGSPGMEGAAALSAQGASHAGAGMVRLGVPGAEAPDGAMEPGPWPLEAVRLVLGPDEWAGDVLAVLERCRALVVGPGLGRAEWTRAQVRRLVAESPVPVVADADALFALGDAASAREVVTARDRPVVLTPHDGEYQRMAGAAPGPDRVSAARDLAGRTGAVVLLKGSLTAVAAPRPGGGGSPGPGVLLAAAGSSRLATAGTGDVLSGVIGAFLARGAPALVGAGLAAHVHGRASSLGPAEGLVAPDLPDLVARWLSGALGDGGAGGG